MGSRQDCGGPCPRCGEGSGLPRLSRGGHWLPPPSRQRDSGLLLDFLSGELTSSFPSSRRSSFPRSQKWGDPDRRAAAVALRWGLLQQGPSCLLVPCRPNLQPLFPCGRAEDPGVPGPRSEVPPAGPVPPGGETATVSVGPASGAEAWGAQAQGGPEGASLRRGRWSQGQGRGSERMPRAAGVSAPGHASGHPPRSLGSSWEAGE